MKKLKVSWILVLPFLLTFVLSAAMLPNSASAKLTIPKPFVYDGLTFTQPLTYSNLDQIPLQPMVITFGTVQRLQVTKLSHTDVLAESITLVPTATKKLIPSPTATPTQTPTPTPEPTILPTSTPTPPTQQVLPASTGPTMTNPGGLDPEKLFSIVNAYRTGKGLPAFEKDEKTCALAQSRAPEIMEEMVNGHMHSGIRARNLPYFNSETIATYHSEEQILTSWLSDQIHWDQVNGNYKYSCVACQGIACVQEYTNYIPK